MSVIHTDLQEFWNWFDPTAWYPLGRPVGSTLFPGLMVTAGLIWHFLRLIHMPVDIRNVCVMLAPGFAGSTAWATYLWVLPLNVTGFCQTPPVHLPLRCPQVMLGRQRVDGVGSQAKWPHLPRVSSQQLSSVSFRDTSPDPLPVPMIMKPLQSSCSCSHFTFGLKRSRLGQPLSGC